MIRFIEKCLKQKNQSPRKYHTLIISIYLLLNAYCAQTQTGEIIQSSNRLYISQINLLGNSLTKRKIITRELSYLEGSRIPQFQIDSLLDIERNKVLNTNLFSDVEIRYNYVAPPSDSIAINISVREKWYFLIIPLLEPADRSLTEWLFNRGASLNRVNYGINAKHRNAFGLKQSISAGVQFGFQRRFSFRYDLPFINKKQRTSLSLGAQYDDNNTVGYITSNNKFVEASIEEKQPIIQRFNMGVRLGKRLKFYGAHQLGIIFFNTIVKDTVSFLNPSFFLEGRTTQRYLQLSYDYTYDRRDLSRYALNGYYLNFSLEKLGIGIFNDVDVTRFDFTIAKYFNLGKEFYFATSLSGKISSLELQPYRISRALGYQNNIVRGLDSFVAEGEHVVTFKNSLRFRAINREFNTAKIIPGFLAKSLPTFFDKLGRGNIMVVPKIYADVGYVKNSNITFDNVSLSNRTLWGTGFGADVVILRSLVLRFEYSFSFRGDTNFAFEPNAEVR